MTNTGPVHHSAAVIGGSDVLLVETLEERAQAASAAVERALRRAVEKSTFHPAVLDASNHRRSARHPPLGSARESPA